jgi:hypothetical protein
MILSSQFEPKIKVQCFAEAVYKDVNSHYNQAIDLRQHGLSALSWRSGA